MWILLDEITFWLLTFMMIGFMALVAVLLVIWLKAPKPMKTIFLIWLMKGVLTIEATASNTLRFVRRRGNPTGGLEATIGKQKSVKFVPQTVNPVLSSPSYLEGTGIPVYFAAEELALALTPTSALATQIALTPEKEELPNFMKEFAKKTGVPLEKLENLLPQTKAEAMMEKRETMFPLDLRNVGRLRLFNIGHLEAAFRNMLEHQHQEGKREGLGERSSTVKYAPLLLVAVAVMGILLLVIYFAGPQFLGL